MTCELTRPAESLTLKIYTLTGRLIRELQAEATAGFIQLKWDGKDDDGNEVANGVYYGKMIVKSFDNEDDQTQIPQNDEAKVTHLGKRILNPNFLYTTDN